MLISLDTSILFVDAFVADPYRNALALLGQDSQISEVVKIATGDLVGTITSCGDGDFLEYPRRLSLKRGQQFDPVKWFDRPNPWQFSVKDFSTIPSPPS